jgi:phosphate transport system substrate-binding protein
MTMSGKSPRCWLFGLAALAVVGCSTETPVRPAPSSAATSTGSADTAGGTTSVDDAAYRKELSGKVELDGSSTVYPISEALANEFEKEYPNVAVTVGKSGTGGGFKRFTKGELDISGASRPIKVDEFNACRTNGVHFLELPVAYDGLTIVVHPQNTWVDQLTVDELKRIYAAPGAATWADVRAGWPQEKIEVFSPGTDSGTFDYFKEEIVGKEGTVRSTMTTSEDDNVLVTGIAGTKHAIGYFGVAYWEENKDKVKAVPVVNPKSGVAIMPTADKIESGEYAPLSRPLFLYVNSQAADRPEVEAFLEFAMERLPKLVGPVGYVPFPSSLYERSNERFVDRLTGSSYLDAQGGARSGPLETVYTPDQRADTK